MGLTTKFTIDKWIEESKKQHGDKYDYSKVVYTKAKNKVTIGCPVHGYFEQVADSHKRGMGCSKCSAAERGKNKRLTQKQFEDKSNKIHDFKYSYTKSKYKNNSLKVIIGCPIHGDFKQISGAHMAGSGCQKCAYEYTAKKQTKSKEKFIEDAISVHGDSYSYEKVIYENSTTKVEIYCKKHKEYFWQLPLNHLKGNGCMKCGLERTNDFKKDDIESFLLKAHMVHPGNNYDYSKVIYKSSDQNINIFCKKHKEYFWQTPNSHLMGSGCPRCSNGKSKGESEIQKLLSKNIKVLNRSRGILEGRREIDIYIPELNLAIEYNGLRWHSELFREDGYHLEKTKEAKEKGINLIHIFEDEWLYKKEIVESRLLNIIGKTKNKIYARKTLIKEVDSKTASKFLEVNHLQGRTGSQVKLGLYQEDELVSLMCFGQMRLNVGGVKKEGDWELIRFANKINTAVIGGASKLLKHFIKIFNPNNITSYADRRWSTGNLYEQIGFELVSKSKPNYFYVIRGKRENRFNYRKNVLVQQGFDANKTERQIMWERGYPRIYDCGTLKYKWSKP